MHKLLRTLLVLLGVAPLLAGCGGLAGSGGEQEAATPTPIPTPIVPDKPTYVVQRGSVVNELEFTGRVAPVEERALYFKTGGYVKRVLVERYDMVQAGDLLAELEIDDLLKQMAQAEVSLKSAQLRLDESEKALERQVSEAELNVVIAQTRLDQARDANADAVVEAQLALAVAQEQLARLKAQQPNYAADVTAAEIGLEQAQEGIAAAQTEYQKAQDRDWEPPEVLEGYARALLGAQRDLEIAQARYNQALAGQQVYQHDLKIQELAVTQAEARLAELEEGVDPLLEIEVQRAQQQLDWLSEGVDPVLVNEVNQAELALERLQAQVADAQISAPIAGQVLSLSVFAGRAVEAFTPAIIVADPDTKEISANLSSVQVGQLAEGQPANAVLNNVPGETWRGIIRRLPYLGSGSSTETLADPDDSVRISLEGDVSGLRLGDLARVSVILEEKEDALWLPLAAIRAFQGRSFVIVQEGDRQRRVDIRTGIKSEDRVEILEGLEEGQIVVGQ